MTQNDFPPEYDPIGSSGSAKLSVGATRPLFKMRIVCATCRRNGHKSQVEIRSEFRTAMGVHRYFNEDGNYVVDDPNKTTTSFECSRGHKWTETY